MLGSVSGICAAQGMKRERVMATDKHQGVHQLVLNCCRSACDTVVTWGYSTVTRQSVQVGSEWQASGTVRLTLKSSEHRDYHPKGQRTLHLTLISIPSQSGS